MFSMSNGFEERTDSGAVIDPFFESQEHHSLIGVANVFLEVLFHDMRLDYNVPIISQHGEVVGKLHVEVYRYGKCFYFFLFADWPWKMALVI